MSSERCWGWLSLAAMAACGGIAVIDPSDGAGGAASSGTAGGPSSTTTANGPTVTTTVTTTGGGADSLCALACPLLESCGPSRCKLPFSDPVCEAIKPHCADLKIGLVECFLKGSPGGVCGMPPDCAEAFLLPWLACEGYVVAFNTCTGSSDGSCACVTDVTANVLVTDCEGSSCACYFDGDLVGTCIGTGPDNCDPYFGCCAAHFFIPFDQTPK